MRPSFFDMLDLKLILSQPEQIQQRLSTRGITVDFLLLEKLNEKRKALQSEFDTLRSTQNRTSEEIQKLKKQKQDAGPLIQEMQKISERIKEITPLMTETEGEIEEILFQLPNLPHSSTPAGKSEEENVVVRSWGEKPVFDFPPLSHEVLGEKWGILDFQRAAKIAGARFALYKKWGAKLERALIQFMLDLHTKEHGYEEVLPPFLVNAQSLIGTGQLPKFEEDLFKTHLSYYLIPTAEVPLTNIHREEILREEDLPISYVAYTPCFRSEAGSYGKDVKGLIRQHQFNKVELVKFTTPQSSYEELERLTSHAEKILQLLKLHYRVVALCTGDLGFSSAKTYDLEVWLPGQNNYREISSCSNFEDFQARRAKIRYKNQEGKNQFVHTLNGSGLAIGRTVVAVLENYQQKDGRVQIPEVLKPYFDGENYFN